MSSSENLPNTVTTRDAAVRAGTVMRTASTEMKVVSALIKVAARAGLSPSIEMTVVTAARSGIPSMSTALQEDGATAIARREEAGHITARGASRTRTPMNMMATTTIIPMHTEEKCHRRRMVKGNKVPDLSI